MLNGNYETLLLVFVALTGVAVLLQSILLLALFLTLRKTSRSLNDQMQELRSTILPAVTEVRDFLARVGPKAESVATDLAEISRSLRLQGADLEAAIKEIVENVRRQTSRVDAMLTSLFDALDRAAGLAGDAVHVPLRQLSALAAGVKAGLGAFRTGRTEPRQIHAPAGEDTFV